MSVYERDTALYNDRIFCNRKDWFYLLGTNVKECCLDFRWVKLDIFDGNILGYVVYEHIWNMIPLLFANKPTSMFVSNQKWKLWLSLESHKLLCRG